MKLWEFIDIFGHMWDVEANKYMPWKLWPKQYEICNIFETEKVLFLPKARQLGGSEIASALSIKVAISEPNSEIIIISRNEREAKYFLKKRTEPFLNQLPHLDDGKFFGSWEFFTERVNFSNGSWIESIPTAEDAGSGRTARLIIMDEARFIEHAKTIYQSARPGIDNNPRGQIIVISNSLFKSWFNRMVRKIYKGDVKGVGLHFLPWNTHPDRNEEWKEQIMSEYDTELDFYSEYPETIEHLFLKREGAIYPQFDPHEGGKHVNKFEPYWAEWQLMYGYDDGYQHPSVFLLMAYDPYSDHLYIIDEVFCYQMDTVDVCKEIMKKLHEWHEKGIPRTAKRKIADTSIFAKKGQKTTADLIKMYTHIHFSKSLKYDSKGSRNMLGSRFTNNKITVHPRCENTRRQITDWVWAKTADQSKEEKPVDNEDDAIDVIRYICAELNQEGRPVEVQDPRPYDQRFNKFKKDFHGPFQPGGASSVSAADANSWQAG